jgi:serine/threonine-protein kinase
MKRFLLSLLLIVVSFIVGLLVVNYVAMPLWVDKKDVVDVPSLIGMEVSRARDILEKKDLKFGIMGQNFNEEMPPGFIISQSPEEGLSVMRGRIVEVLVSLGQESVMVPDVVGFKLAQARILLERAGLVPGEELGEVSEIIKQDGVIRTEPPFKVRVPRGTEVKIFVSLGRTTVDMPLLEGRNLTETQRIVQVMELQIVRIDSVYSPDVREGIVLSQKPPPGSRVVKGQEVELTVSVGP